MWRQCRSFVLDFKHGSDREKITSLLHSGGLYVGRGDGRVECYRDNREYSLQGFELEFDYLESCDVVEKVLAMERFDDGGLNEFLIIGNERNLKVWRVRNRGSTQDIVAGRRSSEYECVCVKECKNVHSYILNSLSLNNDRQYLLSSDYLKINLWKPEKIESCFTIIDVKPQKYNDLVFVINATKFNPEANMVFGYSTSSGEVHINDLRVSSRSSEVLMIDGSDVEGVDSAVRSVSDFQFVDSNLVVTRNLNSVTLYDQRNVKKDIFTTVLCNDANEISSVYESDAVYARFRISCSNSYAFTGCFNSTVSTINLLDGSRDDVAVVCDIEDMGGRDKLKLVSAHGDRFTVACGGCVIEYKYTE